MASHILLSSDGNNQSLELDSQQSSIEIEVDLGNQEVAFTVNKSSQSIQLELEITEPTAILQAPDPKEAILNLDLQLQPVEVLLEVFEGRVGPQGPIGSPGPPEVIYSEDPPVADGVRLWVREKDSQLFIWDGSIERWLGEKRYFKFGATMSNNAYVSFFALFYGPSNAPLNIIDNSRICEVHVRAYQNETKEFSLIVDGSTEFTFQLVNGEYRNRQLAIDVADNSNLHIKSGSDGLPAKDVSGAVCVREVVAV